MERDMPRANKNRRLTTSELKLANKLLVLIGKRLDKASNGDTNLRWALRRKVCKELSYQERGKPMLRVKLKMEKWKAQKGLCAECTQELPNRGAILDRLHAMHGYTTKNTRLLCPPCDARIQEERRFA